MICGIADLRLKHCMSEYADWSWCCNLQAAALAGIICQLQMEVWALKSDEKALGSLLQQVRRCRTQRIKCTLALC